MPQVSDNAFVCGTPIAALHFTARTSHILLCAVKQHRHLLDRCTPNHPHTPGITTPDLYAGATLPGAATTTHEGGNKQPIHPQNPDPKDSTKNKWRPGIYHNPTGNSPGPAPPQGSRRCTGTPGGCWMHRRGFPHRGPPFSPERGAGTRGTTPTGCGSNRLSTLRRALSERKARNMERKGL